jgi:stage V sporulation protein R
MQCLVMAHASAGHSAVFKCNKMFQQFTDAGSIIDYLLFAKNYLKMCEEKYGADEVEAVLDSCHALMDYGVDRYTRRNKISASQESKRAVERLEQQRIDYDPIWDKVVPKKSEIEDDEPKWPKDREDNILYFIEKYAPDLPSWKREVIRIIRKISQYFYPQAQTKVLNEGFATFTHYYIMDKLYSEGLITAGSWLEFITSHTGVIYQPEFDKRWFSGMNPYALGFAMFMDIKRICENPTEEDRKWFPSFAGTPWLPVVKDAMMNYKDDSFIQQFLSPKVIRDFKLFSIKDDADNDYVEIVAIHNDEGYINVRNALADSYNRANWVPDLQVDEVDVLGDRSLYLVHVPMLNRPLHEGLAKQTIAHVANLWEFDVVIETQDANGSVEIEYLAHGPKKPRKT